MSRLHERPRLVDAYEQERPHLTAVAYRLLGSLSEAEDAVQEAWIRLSATTGEEIEHVGAWLTTVVSRIALNMLRSRRRQGARRMPEPLVDDLDGTNPEHAALLAHDVGLALLVLLETLSPAERVAFVLHDVFGMSFEEIAPIVERAPDAARQLASRARRRVQAQNVTSDADLEVQRSLVAAFVAAAEQGDLRALVAVLDPNVVLRVDGGATEGSVELRGSEHVARRAQTFTRAGVERRLALVNGHPGVVCSLRGKRFSVMAFTVRAAKIAAIDILREPAQARELNRTSD
jgi:RNA polymerase sigma factor (sigma-70 family)